jgi:hypothetical protein
MMAFWAAAMVNNSIRWWLVVEMKYGIEIRHENLLKMSRNFGGFMPYFDAVFFCDVDEVVK